MDECFYGRAVYAVYLAGGAAIGALIALAVIRRLGGWPT